MNFAEAVAVLKKDVEEDKNWRSAREDGTSECAFGPLSEPLVLSA